MGCSQFYLLTSIFELAAQHLSGRAGAATALPLPQGRGQWPEGDARLRHPTSGVRSRLVPRRRRSRELRIPRLPAAVRGHQCISCEYSTRCCCWCCVLRETLRRTWWHSRTSSFVPCPTLVWSRARPCWKHAKPDRLFYLNLTSLKYVFMIAYTPHHAQWLISFSNVLVKKNKIG